MKIVEIEAYEGWNDKASHASRGKTARNAPMFEEAGTIYVYFTYGNHFCLNVVTERAGVAGAVLIRAVEPISGVSMMKKRRQSGNMLELANGPGKLTQAFGITTEHSELDLTQPPFYIGRSEMNGPLLIRVGTRIGISRAKEQPLRFYLAESSYVSRR